MSEPEAGRELRSAIEALERRLAEVERELAELRGMRGSPAADAVPHVELVAPAQRGHPVTPQTPPPLPMEAFSSSPEPALPSESDIGGAEPALAEQYFPDHPQAEVAPAKSSSQGRDLEATIGLNWTGWVGAIVFVLGVLFFLKFAWDQGWIRPTPTMRIVAAIITGVIISGVGEWLHRRKVNVLPATLHGAGLAIVMASFFASYAVFEPNERVLGATSAFVCVAITALMGVGIALHINSIICAIIALLGAYLAPFVLNTGEDHSAMLLAYLGALSAVAWALSHLKIRWSPIRALALPGTYLTVAAWWGDLGRRNSHAALASLWLTIYFFGFFTEMLLTIRKIESTSRRPLVESSIALLSLLNTAIAFGLMRAIHPARQDDALLGTVALFLALVQAGAFVATRNRAFGLSAFLQMSALVTLAVPLLLDRFAITLAWLALAVALAAIASQLNLPAARGWAFLLLLLSMLRIFVFDGSLRSRIVLDLHFFYVSQWMLLATAAAVLAHVIAWLRPGAVGKIPWLEAHFEQVLPHRGRLPHLRESRASELRVLNYETPAVPAIRIDTDTDGTLIALIGTMFFFIAAATVYEHGILTLLWIGWLAPLVALARPGKPLAYLQEALGGMLVTAFVWCFINGMQPLLEHWDIPRLSEVLPPVVNMVTLNGLLLCGLVYGLILQYQRIGSNGRSAASALWVLIAAIVFFLVNFEACRSVDWIDTRRIAQMAEPATVKQVVMSVLWAIIGFATIVAGFRRNIAALRYAALALLGLTLAKILLVDMAQVRTIWRILSFVGVGGLLLAVSFIYHQHLDRQLHAGAVKHA